MIRFSLVSLFLIIIAGCKTTEVPQAEEEKVVAAFPKLDNSPFSLKNVPTTDAIFQLTDAQKAHFLDYYYSPKNEHIDEHKRLYRYLESKLDSFDFLGHTYTANEALTNDAGNCLSLAIVTTALADLVGLDSEYQEVNSAPIYHRYHNVTTTSGHVRTIVYKPNEVEEEGTVILRRSRIIIDYFPSVSDVKGAIVSRQDFISMFYQNLAGDAIVAEDYDLAFSYLQEALEQNELNARTINTLAVLNNKVSHHENAEKLFEFGVNHTNKTVNLVSNYADYLKRAGEHDKASALLENVEENYDRNPYSWLDVANQHLEEGSRRLALKYYEKALEIAPYLHEAHFGLAKLHILNGHSFKALVALQKAQELTYEGTVRDLYTAKALTLKESLE